MFCDAERNAAVDIWLNHFVRVIFSSACLPSLPTEYMLNDMKDKLPSTCVQKKTKPSELTVDFNVLLVSCNIIIFLQLR